MTPRFAAALFDVDGTLLDSTDFVLGAVEHSLRLRQRTPPPRLELAAVMGPPLADCYRALAPDLDADALCVTHRAWQRERMHLVLPYPNAAATLSALRVAGVRCAAVTARSKVSSLGTLEEAGIAQFLELTISAEDAARTKPHPDALLLALDKLGVPPSAAVMIGDTASDIQAGQAAGTATIGVSYGFFGNALATYRPDYMVHDITEVLPIICPGSVTSLNRFFRRGALRAPSLPKR